MTLWKGKVLFKALIISAFILLIVLSFMAIWSMLVIAKRADRNIEEGLFWVKFKDVMIQSNTKCSRNPAMKCYEYLSQKAEPCRHCFDIWLGR